MGFNVQGPMRLLCLLLGCSLFTSAASAATPFDRLQVPAQVTQRATQSLLLDIARAGERLVAVGEQGLVLLSDDGGDSWRQAAVPVSVLLTAVEFVDARHGWAVGHDGTVLHSADGGASWRLQLDGNRINALRAQQLEDELDALSLRTDTDPVALEDLEFALDDALFALEDGPSMPLLDVWFADPLHGFVLGAYGQLLRTDDGGEQWQTLGHRLPNPDRFHLNSLLATRSGDLYIAGEAGLLLRSRDSGQVWEALESPYEGSLFAIVEQDGLWLMGLRGNLFHSPNGEDWQALELDSSATLNSALALGEKLLLLGQGGLLQAGDQSGFAPLSEQRSRQSLSAALVAGRQLVLVGEGGIQRKELPAETAQ
ncbi:WD40/YVTN/BNR-like repeat-containing protein [Marinobacterium rhizophilum]|uniref:Photosystem I reaction center subunit IV n=1 Tax=Marinobacterium rhizophilum TaxID=420402 RepID=A0ABY5HE64_9GAMM|nr:YCF48-related protein [Marinobacterium rhizophilum]UTW10117.1 photosystem I reaction center subunit IV [Marinobacterium rhizophilum]